MAKRYHHSKKHQSKHHMPGHSPLFHNRDMHNDEMHHDRMPERFGAYPYDRQMRMRDDLYAGAEARRRQEMRDAGMIHEDPRAIANLPQDVRIQPYPRHYDYMPEGLDDTIRGVDQQMGFDDSQRSRHLFPKKV